MEFRNDHISLNPPSSISYSMIGLKLPNNQDVYFRAKQREIVEQYSAARAMLMETECVDWQHWYDTNCTNNPIAHSIFQTKYKAIFYETALFYYNALIDLSWTICYVCAEFSLQQNGKRVEFAGLMQIEDAAKLLRVAERNVTAPTAETNPFGY